MHIIFVTGVAGYIGSVVTEILMNSGFEVIGIDNFQMGKHSAVNQNIKFYEGNYGDAILLKEIFSNHKIEIVFHFAAETTIDYCMTNPDRYFRNNVVNGLNLLDVMKEFGCKKMVFSSTAATFGEPQYTPIDEKHPQIPINSYGESKLMFEKILDWYNCAYGFKYNLFRYFNAAGATINNGENRLHETHLIPLVLDTILGKKSLFKVFGSNYDTKDGTCIRDYVHVEDIAQGHILALKNIDRNARGKYNLGSGTGFSILEVIKTVEEVTGKKVNFEFSDKRAGDPAILVASSELAMKELGWKPFKSNLKEMVEDAYFWLKKIKSN